MVDCECGDGVPPLLECDAESIETARDAICPATPEPTSSPTMIPTTLIPTIKPTRFPTLSPTPAPTAPSPPVLNGCLSGNVQVEVRDQGMTLMKDVRVGDQIMTPHGYETIYMFGHIDPHETMEFLRIEFRFLNSPPSFLELTEDHLVFIQDNDNKRDVHPVRASSLRVGSKLLMMTGAARPTTTYTKLPNATNTTHHHEGAIEDPADDADDGRALAQGSAHRRQPPRHAADDDEPGAHDAVEA